MNDEDAEILTLPAETLTPAIVAKAIREGRTIHVPIADSGVTVVEGSAVIYAVIKDSGPAVIPWSGTEMPKPLARLSVIAVIPTQHRGTTSISGSLCGSDVRVMGETIHPTWGSPNVVKLGARSTTRSAEGETLTEAATNAIAIISEVRGAIRAYLTEREAAIVKYQEAYRVAMAS